jgi:MtN3 and saliva related transmembrane protein
MSNLLVTTIGVGAALCSMTSFIPQALKVIREHDATSVSLRMYVVTVIGFALWATYGVMLQSWPVVVSNLVSLGLSGLILGLKLRYPDAPKAA